MLRSLRRRRSRRRLAQYLAVGTGNLTPNEIVRRQGDTGLERARAVLTRIEYGVYS